MKKLLFAFLLGLATGAGGFWYVQQESTRKNLEQARVAVAAEAGRMKEAIQATIGDIRVEDVRKELAHSGMVVREKASRAGSAISDAAANARTTAGIKARLLTEPGLSALAINVDSTGGLVTLSGTVGSHEQIAKAVRIALETDGVTKVVSTLQVKAAQ